MEEDTRRYQFKIMKITRKGVFKQLLNTIVNARHRSQRKGISAVKHARLSHYAQELKAAGGALAAALHTDHVAQQKMQQPTMASAQRVQPLRVQQPTTASAQRMQTQTTTLPHDKSASRTRLR